MAPHRSRITRENQFYNVGVQGRKTGITIEDRGVYDEYGLESLSGIFSSPAKSPPKRGGLTTGSESMDLQESSIPELTTSHQILRNNRTHLPPPRSRSPKKTALGSSPRRQSSMAPRAASSIPSSPARALSHPAVARRLDFDQEESSLQETPALSGSGQRREKRADVYDILENSSPMPVMDESQVQQELEADEDPMANVTEQEISIAQIGDDTVPGAEDAEDLADVNESEIVQEPPKQPAKRGRKRKSDVLENTREDKSGTTGPRKRGVPSSQTTNVLKRLQPSGPARRSKRVSDMTEQDSSILATSLDGAEDTEDTPVAQKKRGRPAKARPDANQENISVAKAGKASTSKTTERETAPFKKPSKPATKPAKKAVSKTHSNKAGPGDTPASTNPADLGKFVDVTGKPLSKKDIEQMSVTSVGSRYGRGRTLSVFRELEPEAVARIGRTGRHRVSPIDFWKNDRISYDPTGGMTSVVKNSDPDSPRKRIKTTGKGRPKKRSLTAIEEEELELEPWEEEGTLIGNFRDYEPMTDSTTSDVLEDTIAWASKGIHPAAVSDGSFGFEKLSSVGSFFNWGIIELQTDQMKRTKNARRMHMVFNVQLGTVEVKMAENEFTVHRNGIWQVPRGNTYSIRNVGTGTARVFFAQATETVQAEE